MQVCFLKLTQNSPVYEAVNRLFLCYNLGMKVTLWSYYNPNPSGKQTGDCVIRAISKVLDLSWIQVYVELSAQGLEMYDWGNSDPVWGAYLKAQGFKRRIIPNTCPDCYTIGDFAEEHTRGRYVLGTGRHAVAVVDGIIYDSWDSSNELPTFYFYKEGF